MKTVLITGANEFMYNVAEMVNPKEMKLVGFATTDSSAWNVLDEKGNVLDEISGMPVMPIDLIGGYNPDIVIIAADTEERNTALKYMVYRAGFQNEVILFKDLMNQFSNLVAVIRRLAYRIDGLGIAGNIAELGCYKGDTAWQMNALMPTRKLYLFDTFEGFDPRDIAKEEELKCSAAKSGEQRFANTDKLMERMPEPEQVVLRKGWFPLTAEELEDESFALVHIDACLYQPTLTGLEFFYPRMSKGGVIVLSGYEDPDYQGVRLAVEEIEKKYGAFLLLPAGDSHGTVMIIKP